MATPDEINDGRGDGLATGAASGDTDDALEIRQGIRSALMAIGRRWAVSQVRLVRLSVMLDDSGEWALDGSPTCSHWLAVALDIEVGTAREWLRIGRSLVDLPHADRAFNDGRISFTKVRTLTRIATAASDAELCALAERTPAGRLGTALAAWSARHDDPDERDRRQRRDRSLTWRDEPDGTVLVTARLTPEQAGAVRAAIDTAVWTAGANESGQEPLGPAVDGVGRAGLTPRQSATERGFQATASRESHQERSHGVCRETASVARPTLAQQRVDAMVRLLTGGGSNLVSEVIVHIRGDGVSFDDGSPLAGSVVERIAPTAFLRVMIHDAERRPINASGRRRHPTVRQRRVVAERDRQCVDCGGRAFLEFDHVPAFESTGRTVIDELQLRCSGCHRRRHVRQVSPRAT